MNQTEQEPIEDYVRDQRDTEVDIIIKEKQNPNLEIKKYNDKLEELRKEEEANLFKKKRGDNRIKMEKDPMDAIKKKIERQMIENKMEKRVDSKI